MEQLNQDMAAMVMDDSEPVTFKQAWDHSDEKKREKWREAINKKFKDMNDRKVFRKIKRNEMPAGKCCVKSKWVFKEKRNGVFRARLVACGYSQIPGVDFVDIPYSPVVNDAT
jgi:hypothetical protein